MYYKSFLTLLLLALPFYATAQINDDDPFFRNYILGQNSEILTINGGADTAVVRIFDSPGDISTDGLNLINSNTINAPWGINGDSTGTNVDIITADFNTDGIDDFIGAWQGPDSTVTLYFAEFNPNTFEFAKVSPISIQSLGYPKLKIVDAFEYSSIIRLETAQIDNDPAPEIVLAYWGDEGDLEGGPIQVIIFEINSLGELIVIDDLADKELTPEVEDSDNTLIRSTKFEIVAADFNADEIDELALFHVSPGVDFGSSNDFGWQLNATIYEFQSSSFVNVGGSTSPLFQNDGSDNKYLQRMALTSGDYNGDVREELGLIIGMGLTNAQNFEMDAYSLIVEPDFSNVSIADDIFVNSTSGNSGWPMSATSGDMNFDGMDELVVFFRNNIRIYQMDTNLVLDWVGGINIGANTTREQRFHRTVSIADLDITNSDSLRYEVVSIDNEGLKVWQNNPENDAGDDGIDLGNNSSDYVAIEPITSIAVATGDFDGDAVRLGQPTVQTVNDIVQPLVILNAPPIHFDVIDETSFDINKCFNLAPDQTCTHRAIYENASSSELEVSTQISTDWGLSASLTGKAEGKFGPVSGSIEATISGAYGEGFSKYSGTSQTVTVKVTSDAIVDDRIYGTISSYDIYEYPVYSDNEITGYAIVVNPKFIGLESLQNTWFGSKSGLAGEYIPNHEVGNILSYPSSAELPFGAAFFGSGGFEGGGGDTWEYSSNSTQTWELRFGSQSISRRTNSSFFDVGVSATATGSVDFGFAKSSLSATVSAEYGQDQISTHTTTVKDESALLVEFGTIDGSILGSKTYTVSPFVYWAANGALVLDYAVNPDISSGVPSWWEEQYASNPDLTFILPWEHDEAKGLGSTNPELQSEETRDIIFFPSKPKPNSVADIQVRVQNQSLTDATTTSWLRLYIGDPRNGGIPITDAQGDSLFAIPVISARGAAVITVSGWQIPENVGGNTFIYAQIDSENNLIELKENNNIAWVLLNETLPSVTSTEDFDNIVKTFELKQNYPNPFNPITTIEYSIKSPQNVTLEVFDVMGRKIATLVDNMHTTGTYSTRFDASQYSSGVYIYKLNGESFSISKRMLLLK